MDRVGWVKLLDREMKNASNEDDAIARDSRVFDASESSIHAIANTGINQVVYFAIIFLSLIVLSFSSLVDGRNGERSEGVLGQYWLLSVWGGFKFRFRGNYNLLSFGLVISQFYNTNFKLLY